MLQLTCLISRLLECSLFLPRTLHNLLSPMLFPSLLIYAHLKAGPMRSFFRSKSLLQKNHLLLLPELDFEALEVERARPQQLDELSHCLMKRVNHDRHIDGIENETYILSLETEEIRCRTRPLPRRTRKVTLGDQRIRKRVPGTPPRLD